MTMKSHDFDCLPVGRAPKPLPTPHFPDTLHAVIWRNWDVVDAAVLADVLGGTLEQISAIAASMGLPEPRPISEVERRRNYMTVVRRNWHLLPYAQIADLVGWDAETFQFALNEDDFMWVKLGGYKPDCPFVSYVEPDDSTWAAAEQIRQIVSDQLGNALSEPAEPPYGFIRRFGTSESVTGDQPLSGGPRIVYPYFLRYGDPLTGEGIDDIPDSYLRELATSGVNAIWLQAVLNTLYPWELAPHLADRSEERIANLKKLVDRCAAFGIEVLLYLNEPRAMPPAFFNEHPDLRGVDETPDRKDYSPDVKALCTSTQPVKDFLTDATRNVFERVPGLGGVILITFSENLTNCYSREYDSTDLDPYALRSELRPNSPARKAARACPRCKPRGPAAVNAEVCELIERGMRQAGSDAKFMLYAWSTPEPWFADMLERLPESTWLICISEWGKPFRRGDYSGTVNEYSISVVGPSDQAKHRWAAGKKKGLKTLAKMQVGNTYEFSSIPYIPALRLVGEHLANVSAAELDGLMLGWTAGGSPSPNLDLIAEFVRPIRPSVAEALKNVARRRFGDTAAAGVVEAWNLLSDAYAEFPFDIGVCYFAPQSLGPANLLLTRPSGLAATMCTFPYDDIDGWRGPYSAQTLLDQFTKVADLWSLGVRRLAECRASHPSPNLDDEYRIAAAAGIHFRSVVNQIRFIIEREQNPAAAVAVAQDEIGLARDLLNLVREDSRIGFEATNQYGYTRFDLAEKVLNCVHVIEDLQSVG